MSKNIGKNISYRFLSFAKNMSKNIGKNISKNLSRTYSQKIDHAKQSAALRTTKIAADAHKTVSKRATQKRTEETGDLNGNKVVDKIIQVYHKIVQSQLQMKQTVLFLIEKYVRKDTYLQKIIDQIIDALRLIS